MNNKKDKQWERKPAKEGHIPKNDVKDDGSDDNYCLIDVGAGTSVNCELVSMNEKVMLALGRYMERQCLIEKQKFLQKSDVGKISTHNAKALESGDSKGAIKKLEKVGPSLSIYDNPDMKIEYNQFESEEQLQAIINLIEAELSEPYSIYTYRYFIHNWPHLCFLAKFDSKYIGTIICKLDMHENTTKRGYIAMLAVAKEYRNLRVGTNLVLKAINAMINENADEVVLETLLNNKIALRLYENLGFVRAKRLYRYYMNGEDATRLKLWLN